jgi:hypothetical protein
MRSSLALLGTAALALSLACGGSGPAPAPGPGGPPGDQQPAGAPAEDRSVTVARLDPHAECDALVPARIPGPVTARVEDPGGACTGAITDGTGHVAVGIALALPWSARQIFSPAGAPERRFTLWHVIAPQADGWLVPQGEYSHGPGRVSLESLGGDGAVAAAASFAPVAGRSWQFGADPRGGGFLVVHPFRSSSDAPCTGEGRHFDASGAQRGEAASVGCHVRAAAVSTAGDALAIELGMEGASAGRSILHWVRPDGSHARPPADEGDSFALLGSSELELAPLLDGSLALRTPAGWYRRYPHLAARGEGAPAWLAARGQERFRSTRGSRGYAFFPAAGEPAADCRQAIELVAPSGRRCARLTFREDAAGCVTGAIDQGWDGTVVQQSGKDPCTYRWWPGLLAE